VAAADGFMDDMEEPIRYMNVPEEITLNYHERVYLDDLLDTNWEFWHFRANIESFDYGPAIRHDNGILSEYHPEDFYLDYFFAIKAGTTYIIFTAPDGSVAITKVTVKYTPLQWFCVIALGGWFWMKYTPLGEFSLIGTIRHLFPGDGFKAAFGRLIGAILNEFDLLMNNFFWRNLLGPFGTLGPTFIRFPHESLGLYYWPPEIYPF